MRNTFSIIALVLLGGCVSAPNGDTGTKATSANKLTTAYDLSEVCLTDQGKPVSKGMIYKGKTCSQPATISFEHKNILEWR